MTTQTTEQNHNPYIYKVKISAKEVRRLGFPFDVVYLLRRKYRALIPRMLQHALVIPMDSLYRNRLLPLEVSETIAYPSLGHEIKTPFLERLPLREIVPLPHEDLLMVVPLLVTAAEASAKLNYLTSVFWKTTREVFGRHYSEILPIPLDAYLVTPDAGFVNPICKLCSRYIDQQAGRCTLGTAICTETLFLPKKGTFPTEFNSETV